MRQSLFVAALVGLVLAVPTLFAGPDSGDTMWTRTYNSPGNGDDEAVGIVIDNAGNAYVAGIGEGQATGLDGILIKYAPNGTEEWATRFAGPSYSADQWFDIALGPDGNPVLTGSTGTFPNYNIVTAKYNAATGDTLWRRTYAGPDNAEDVGRAVVVDPDGNAYVAGHVTDADQADFITIKYTPDGGQVWAEIYDGGNGSDNAVAIALAGSGVVVAGTGTASNGLTDYLVIKYDAGGTPQWLERYDGPASHNDVAAAMSVSSTTGAVAVTGFSMTGPAPAGRADYATVMFNSSGARQWAHHYTGANRGSEAFAVIFDAAGSVFVTGRTQNTAGNSDIATLKYTSTGTVAWTQRFDGPGRGSDQGMALAVDPRTNELFVAGTAVNRNGDNDAVVIRYATDRDSLMGYALYNSIMSNDDRAVAVAVDGQSNVFIAGKSFQGMPSASYRALTVKYRPGGIGVAEPSWWGHDAESCPQSPILVRPNPVRNRAEVAYTIGRPGAYSLALYSADGRLCRLAAQGTAGAGIHTTTISTAGLARGAYLLKLTVGPTSATTRIVVE
ncbi:T9SS type A sorting domain-containing protein [candidate division WOR-3 bacterium]|nr:T9SS type A sorting domain-containing protein [candidate division WOR-3 bacterium]